MNWHHKNNLLEKDFNFETFRDALKFVCEVAKIADKINHHPDILIHNYNKVRVQTTTHSEGQITQKDYELIAKILEINVNLLKEGDEL